MGWILLIAAVIGIIVLIGKRIFRFGLAPQSLELKPIKAVQRLSYDLEQSLPESYMKNVEERVKKERKLKENEYEWRLLDLKRYFLLTSLLKEAPMFSTKVDDLWHEMLMFTREYDEFSRKYLGSTLHHSPNVKQKSDPDLRGFFDWVYAELFLIRQENIHLYKGFFRHPVNPHIIEQFRDLPENELLDLYFKSDTKYMSTVLSLISAMKRTANRVKDDEKKVIQGKMRKSKTQKDFNAMLVPFLSVSFFHYDEFASYMSMGSSNSSSSCTSCGSGASSSCSTHSCSNHSCSSHSSCSSCSSCGGGGD